MAETDPTDLDNARFTKLQIGLAWRLLRGSKPELGEVERLQEKTNTIDQLRRIIVSEAGARLHGFFQEMIQQRFLRAPKPEVEVDVPRPVLEKLLAHTEEVWRALGEADPFWSVLTKFKPAGAELDKEAFYQTGRKRVDMFAAALARADVDIAALPVCFELGSGVGRLTYWLADRFKRVVAADISSAHIQLAERELKVRGKDNVAFVRVGSMAELDNVEPFDAFFSMISLQHSPPPVIKYVLETLLGKLNPGGVAYFQLPTLVPEQRFEARAYLADLAAHEQMETFCVPQRALFALLDRLGLKLLEIREDNQCGPHKLSNTLLVQRPR